MSQDDTTEPVIAAVTDGAYALVVADFADVDQAWAAYQELREVADADDSLRIEGVVVVKRGYDGEFEVQKATDHSTKSGLKWGLVGGIAMGLIFPPSVIGTAVALGAAGAGIGKIRQLHHHSELEDQLKDGVEFGHSGLIAVVSDPAAVKIQKALDKADRVIDAAIADVAAQDIKAEAKAARKQAKAEAKAARKQAKAEAKAAKRAAKQARKDEERAAAVAAEESHDAAVETAVEAAETP